MEYRCFSDVRASFSMAIYDNGFSGIASGKITAFREAMMAGAPLTR